MAKYLDAMQRAREQRDQQQGQPPAGQGEQPFESPAAPLPSAGFMMRAAAGTVSDQLVGLSEAQSPATEQIRHICTNLESMLTETGPRTVVISSPVGSDGKTVISANLASVLADTPDHKVILVDADMRKPRQHDLFGLDRAPGLSEYLQGKAELDQMVRATPMPNLSIIPAGRTPAKPTVLLGSERMTALLAELQRRYHWVLIDTPPLLPVTDATILGREASGLIMVVRMGQTQDRKSTRLNSSHT